ncbi:hypothetical protein AYO21_09129 [Fonsecaea monophora]|uniref:Protein kinase domain-containing protein n=1 Tax=Fonsecaea monophora TaxID=254056 RepID=A0A177EX60_9EURO|nr:hypothetical protein AYO21_09129 [Fonsecaea monophora]OAG36654.1 hypothetical protein AYO21_09129 [Fonsecaea monophora]
MAFDPAAATSPAAASDTNSLEIFCIKGSRISGGTRLYVDCASDGQIQTSDKSAITKELRSIMDQLRALKPPEPSFYSNLERCPISHFLFNPMKPNPTINGPFVNKHDFVQGLVHNLRTIDELDHRDNYKTEFYEQNLPSCFRLRRPKITHGDIRRKNIMGQQTGLLVNGCEPALSLMAIGLVSYLLGSLRHVHIRPLGRGLGFNDSRGLDRPDRSDTGFDDYERHALRYERPDGSGLAPVRSEGAVESTTGELHTIDLLRMREIVQPCALPYQNVSAKAVEPLQDHDLHQLWNPLHQNHNLLRRMTSSRSFHRR